MNSARCSAWVAFLVMGALGCERRSTTSEADDVEPNEPSPNAHILPAPLQAPQTRTTADRSSPASGAALVRQTLPAQGEVEREDPPNVVAVAGFEFRVDFQLNEVRAGAELGAEARRAHASWLVQSTTSSVDVTGSRAARQRIALEGALFTLPEGTELRSRADRIGSIVVWPDGRSYRVVPRGALAGLLEERRVDIMPPFDMQLRSDERREHDRGKWRERVLSSPLGELRWISEELPELGDSSLLFCQTLLELLRIDADERACAPGERFGEARFVWAEGGELKLTASAFRRRTDMEIAQFALPPQMAIFKPGELPPDVERPWPTSTTNSLIGSGGPVTTTVKNGWDVPVLLFFDGLPVLRLDPEQEWRGSTVLPVQRYQARDFLGHHARPAAAWQAGGRYQLGADPELRPDKEPLEAQQ